MCPAAESTSPRQQVDLPRRWLPASTWPRPRCGHRTAAICCFGATATVTPKHGIALRVSHRATARAEHKAKRPAIFAIDKAIAAL